MQATAWFDVLVSPPPLHSSSRCSNRVHRVDFRFARGADDELGVYDGCGAARSTLGRLWLARIGAMDWDY